MRRDQHLTFAALQRAAVFSKGLHPFGRPLLRAMIEIQGLTKSFGPIAAVAGIDLTVAQGEVLGFLGPNSAGKSTTMKMITGFLAPSAGRVRVCGHDLETDALGAQRAIGYLPEGAPAYGDMTPRQFLHFIAEVRGFHGVEAQGARGRSRRQDRTRSRARPAHRHAVQGLQAPGRIGAGHSARPAGPHHGRTHRRSRSQPETRRTRASACDGAQEGDHRLDPSSRRGRGDLHARGDHRPRPHRRRRHAGGASRAFAPSQRRDARFAARTGRSCEDEAQIAQRHRDRRAISAHGRGDRVDGVSEKRRASDRRR